MRNATGDSPPTTPVAQLDFKGSIVGQIDHGRIVAVPNQDIANLYVTGPDGKDVNVEVSATGLYVFNGTSLRFRAVGGTYKLRIYGRRVDLNAVGQGVVRLDGSIAQPTSDGMFSVNGGDWRSLPAIKTAYTVGT